jgi:hypothetical protein
VSEGKRGLYRMVWDAGRMGTLSGLFTATDEEVKAAIGQRVYFGEVLGKHSEVYGTLEKSEVSLVTDDPAFVSKFDEYGCASGYNPLDYINEEEGDE